VTYAGDREAAIDNRPCRRGDLHVRDATVTSHVAWRTQHRARDEATTAQQQAVAAAARDAFAAARSARREHLQSFTSDAPLAATLVTDGSRATLEPLYRALRSVLVSDRAKALDFWAMQLPLRGVDVPRARNN
jgi:hypothetical protein